MPYLIVAFDKSPIFLKGIKTIIEQYKDFKILETFNIFDELIDFLNKNNTNILITDLQFRKSGADGIKYIHNKYPNIKILVLTDNLNEIEIFSALKMGAIGYIDKHTTEEKKLYQALNAIVNNEEYFSEPVSTIILRNYVKNIKKGEEISEKKPRNLTRREIQILKLISEGLTNKQIADGLFISVRTVETHKNNIMQKLKLKNTVELIKFAIKHGYIKL